jgi:hypothetical protein
LPDREVAATSSHEQPVSGRRVDEPVEDDFLRKGKISEHQRSQRFEHITDVGSVTILIQAQRRQLTPYEPATRRRDSRQVLD